MSKAKTAKENDKVSVSMQKGTFPIFVNTFRVIYFTGIWLLLWLTYGDVLFQMQEYSLWMSVSLKECELLALPSDIFTYVCRLVLTLFAFPCVGALFLAAMLSLSEILTDRIIRLRPGCFAVSYIPSLVSLYMIFRPQYEIYFRYENSTIIKIIFLILLILFILSTVRTLFFNDSRNTATFKEKTAGPGIIAFNTLLVVASVCILFNYSNRDKDFRQLTEVKYHIAKEEWVKAADAAERIDETTKPTAAFHAIALTKTGMLGDRLFNIHHNYKPLKVVPGSDESKFGEFSLYFPETYLHLGLTVPAYHHAMDYAVRFGLSKFDLKVMVKASIVNGEKAVAEKFLSMLSRVPFEKEFVRRFRYLNENPDAIKDDSELSQIYALHSGVHLSKSCEQFLADPIFVNFYKELDEIPTEALDIVLASNLYLKDINGFLSIIEKTGIENHIPRYYQEVIAIASVLSGNNEILKEYSISPNITASVNRFVNEMQKYSSDRERGADALKGIYGHSYMYYNVFEKGPVR